MRASVNGKQLTVNGPPRAPRERVPARSLFTVHGSRFISPMPVDILAIAAHRDDVELTCAGTLLKAVDAGYRTGILDLTAGEAGTRGSAAGRAEEAERAAEILRVSERRNAG